MRDYAIIVVSMRAAVQNYESAMRSHDWEAANGVAGHLELLAHEARIIAQTEGMKE